MSAVNPFVEGLFDRLTSASIAILLMVGLAWIACRLRPSLTPAARTTLWWLVALAALLRLAPIPALTIEVPQAWNVGAVLREASRAPVAAANPPAAVAPAHPTPAEVPVRLANQPFVPPAAVLTPPARSAPVSDWRAPVAALWGVVAAALLLQLTIQTRRLRSLARDADPAPADVHAEATRLAAELGLRHLPVVRVSDAIDTPQVVGLLRPAVLLPADVLATMTPRERAMTLCHELAHVRRLDLAFAWAPAVMERLLFFHPAARLAAREYAFAREAACDAEVLQHLGEAPRDYGRLLLRLGVTRRPAALAAAQSSPSARLLRRRLAMLDHHLSAPRPWRGLWIAGGLVVVLATPLSLVARQDDVPPAPPAPPTPAAAAMAPAPPVPGAPAVPPAPPDPAAPARVHGGVPRGVSGGVPGGIPGGAPGGVPGGIDGPYGNLAGQAPPPPPPPPPARNQAPPPPPPPPPPPSGFAWAVSEGKDTWVLIDGEGSHVYSGSWRHADEVKKLRGSDSGPFLYYRTDGRAYVSRDPALIARIRAEMKEQQVLGAQQGALGAEQAALGAKQAALGSEQGALGARQHEMAAKMAARGMAHAQIGTLEGALAALDMQTADQSAELEAARKALREAIEALRKAPQETAVAGHAEEASAKRDRMREAERQMRDLGRRQAELGQKQAELGRRQAELGHQQRVAAELARKRILEILEEARAKGQVESVK